jgi:hypothetical protein
VLGIGVVSAELFLGLGGLIGLEEADAAPEGEFLAGFGWQLWRGEGGAGEFESSGEVACLDEAEGEHGPGVLDERGSGGGFRVVCRELGEESGCFRKVLLIEGEAAAGGEFRGGEVCGSGRGRGICGWWFLCVEGEREEGGGEGGEWAHDRGRIRSLYGNAAIAATSYFVETGKTLWDHVSAQPLLVWWARSS